MNVLVNPFRLNPDRENSSLKLKETRNPPKGRAEKNLVSGKIWRFLSVTRQVYTCTNGLSRYHSIATLAWSRKVISHKSVRS